MHTEGFIVAVRLGDYMCLHDGYFLFVSMSHHPSFQPNLERHRFLAQLYVGQQPLTYHERLSMKVALINRHYRAFLNQAGLDGVVLQPRSTSPVKQRPIQHAGDELQHAEPEPSTSDESVETFLMDGVLFPREGPFGRGCLKFVLRAQPGAIVQPLLARC